MRDKIVVVTGGFGVLGQAVAEAALAAEAYVAIPSREQERNPRAGPAFGAWRGGFDGFCGGETSF